VATYLKSLALAVLLAGVAGSALCWNAARTDEAYFRALKGVEKYPGNVLYKTELKMAEPGHLLLVAGAVGAAPLAIVISSALLGLALVLERQEGRG